MWLMRLNKLVKVEASRKSRFRMKNSDQITKNVIEMEAWCTWHQLTRFNHFQRQWEIKLSV